jgi:ATP-dependent DNA helicase RecG
MTNVTPDSTLLDHVLAAAQVGENDDWEFKSAKGGFPGSVWETYSAMANSAGGTIVLGASEKNGKVSVDGLETGQLDKSRKTLWDGLNNRGVVSRNLLANSQVESLQIENGSLLIIKVPQATRKERPIYKGQNPFGGTFKRQHEGDYKCSDEEVRRMIRPCERHSGRCPCSRWCSVQKFGLTLDTGFPQPSRLNEAEPSLARFG